MPNAEIAVGSVLSGRFRLTRLLGEGGMGVVYGAESVTAPTETFAIKMLRPELALEVDVLARFLDEGRACLRLIHPNILRVFECLQTEDGNPYLVMELLEGVPLSAYTASGGRVPPAQAIVILQGILAGLAAAHAQGVIHRDLKPDNVFLAREANGQFQVKLLDFGIAKVMDAAGGMGKKTKTGQLLGTPAYMSPEQIRSAKDVDARADVWSAGVMGYEMLSGRAAFPAPTEYARLSAVLSANPQPLEAIDRVLAPISPVIARAMQKEKDARFPSAMEMARALTSAAAAGVASPAAESAPGVRAAPLSRLPDVPSMFAPNAHPMAQSPAALSEPHTKAATPAPAVDPSTGRAPGGTLASATGKSVIELPPQVVLAPQGTTMPSKDLPMLAAVASGKPRFARGVAAWLVVVLVIAALAAGFVLGYAMARAT